MTRPNEVDETAEALATQLRRAMIVARRAAQTRRMAATRRQTAPSTSIRAVAAVTAAARAARENASLADAWRREALAARWAAADVTRHQDPVAAAAWDERVRDTGVDPDEVRTAALDTADSKPGLAAEPDPVLTEAEVRDRWFRRGMVAPPSSPAVLGADPVTGPAEQLRDVRAAADPELPQSFPAVIGADGPTKDGAADLITEYLAETYTQEAVDRGGPPNPGPEPTIGELIAATEPPPGTPTTTPDLTTDPAGVVAGLDRGAEQIVDEGIGR